MLVRALTFLALTGVTAALAACGGGGGASTTGAGLPAGCEQVATPSPKRRELKRPPQTVKRGERLTATVDTSCGRFDIRLDTTGFPKTVNSFAYLAKKRFYDDTIFHRIVPHFIVQGGDPLQNGQGGPGYTVTETPPRNTTYTMGTVAMAKTAVEPAGRSGSQFFIVITADAGLPPNYAILGKVSSGLDVVKRIGELGDPASGDTGTPMATVVIRRITIHGAS
jgi:peptidyl-prolyl cis-trans isomerase B (cyclophilin B)